MRILRIFGVCSVVVSSLITALCVWFLANQGGSAVDWTRFPPKSVTFDNNGIPTISASTWEDLIHRQGYVHASERLWQMDVSRRAGSGRLSEWFGEKTIAHDTKVIQQNWHSVAVAAAALLPKPQAAACSWYARGVNDFIVDAKNHWGVEYTLMRTHPEPWTCVDAILVLMMMAEDLGGSADMEFRQSFWREALSEEWQTFLFPRSHPWAAPYFGKADPKAPTLPPVWQYLPATSATKKADSPSGSSYQDPMPGGSNAWVWSNGVTTLLASDPHLGLRAPQLWYANHLRLEGSDQALVHSVSGASLPGIPGVVIGANTYFAWSFTNLGDDVDDYLEESIDGDLYLAYEVGGRQHWRRLVQRDVELKVRGQKTQMIKVRSTHRGPIIAKSGLKKDELRYLSRQWIALQPEKLQLPTVQLNQSKNWSEFNQALDSMLVPAQVAIFADNEHNLGFRVSGVDIKRRKSGHIPQSAISAEWAGYGTPSERKRLFLPAKGAKDVRFIANANAQIWQDDAVQRWMSDDRRERIVSLLQSLKDAPDVAAMEKLQLDSYSRFSGEFCRWILTYLNVSLDEDAKIIERWRRWDYRIESDQITYSDMQDLERYFVSALLDRVRSHFFSSSNDLPNYESFLRRAWMLKLIEAPNGLALFGIDAKELVGELYAKLKSEHYSAINAADPGARLHSRRNLWQGQHPLEDVPIVGRIFAVRHLPQLGSATVVRAESERHGPSMRMVWDLTNRSRSSWMFPVGQSGHVASPHYRDLQKAWNLGTERLQINAK
jgi:penicillin amidase